MDPEKFGSREPGDAFRVDDHVVSTLELSSEVEFGENRNLGSDVSAEYLPDEVTDSPLIEDDYHVEASVTLTYNFSPF